MLVQGLLTATVPSRAKKNDSLGCGGPAACLDATVGTCTKNTEDETKQTHLQSINYACPLFKLISFNTNLPDPKLSDAVGKRLPLRRTREEIIPAQPGAVGTTSRSRSDLTFLEMHWEGIQRKPEDL